jgi:hypothetical protein
MELTPTMAKTRMFVSVSIFLVVIMTLTMVGFHVSAEAVTRPAIFIFGDSTVDIGTNNFIPESGARAL